MYESNNLSERFSSKALNKRGLSNIKLLGEGQKDSDHRTMTSVYNDILENFDFDSFLRNLEPSDEILDSYCDLVFSVAVVRKQPLRAERNRDDESGQKLSQVIDYKIRYITGEELNDLQAFIAAQCSDEVCVPSTINLIDSMLMTAERQKTMLTPEFVEKMKEQRNALAEDIGDMSKKNEVGVVRLCVM
jgi:hypothetical protein